MTCHIEEVSLWFLGLPTIEGMLLVDVDHGPLGSGQVLAPIDNLPPFFLYMGHAFSLFSFDILYLHPLLQPADWNISRPVRGGASGANGK